MIELLRQTFRDLSETGKARLLPRAALALHLNYLTLGTLYAILRIPLSLLVKLNFKKFNFYKLFLKDEDL